VDSNAATRLTTSIFDILQVTRGSAAPRHCAIYPRFSQPRQCRVKVLREVVVNSIVNAMTRQAKRSAVIVGDKQRASESGVVSG
jgi:hypothetical protein